MGLAKVESVKWTKQDEIPVVVATRLHVLESKDPGPAEPAFIVKVTVPVGLVGPVALVSVTVAVQVEAWFTTTGVSQLTLVVVGWRAAGVTWNVMLAVV